MKNNSPMLIGSKQLIVIFLLFVMPAISHAERYSYDTSGRLVSVTYTDGSAINYDYDSNSNILKKTVTAATIPKITLLGSSPVIIAQGATYTDAGATAMDNNDGDISASIVVSNPVDTAVIGSYTIRYDVKDSDNNSASQVTRVVNVTDQTPPVINLLGASPVTIIQGGTYADAGATATDNNDGDISSNIVTTNPVNTGTIGSYTVSYNVSDAAGNAAAEVTRTVNVVNAGDQSAPVITLLGATPVNITQGTAYNDAGATATDDVDGDITSRIVTVNPVNTNVTGSYTITYDVKDSAGNAASQVVRVVNVTSPPAPAPTPEKKKSTFGSVGLVSLLLLLFPVMFRFFARSNERKG